MWRTKIDLLWWPCRQRELKSHSVIGIVMLLVNSIVLSEKFLKFFIHHFSRELHMFDFWFSLTSPHYTETLWSQTLSLRDIFFTFSFLSTPVKLARSFFRYRGNIIYLHFPLSFLLLLWWGQECYFFPSVGPSCLPTFLQSCLTLLEINVTAKTFIILVSCFRVGMSNIRLWAGYGWQKLFSS